MDAFADILEQYSCGQGSIDISNFSYVSSDTHRIRLPQIDIKAVETGHSVFSSILNQERSSAGFLKLILATGKPAENSTLPLEDSYLYTDRDQGLLERPVLEGTRLFYPLSRVRFDHLHTITFDTFAPSVNPWYDPLAALKEVFTLIAKVFYEVCCKSPLFWILATFLIVSWVRNDYDAYLRVGRGGTASTPWGWWRTKRLNFVLKYILQVEVLSDPFVDPMTEPYRGRLFDLPRRDGDRPKIIGLAPQRQADQKVSPQTELDLVSMLEKKAHEKPDTLIMDRSYLEGHLRALKRRLGPTGVPGMPGTDAEWGGEIAHVHKLDGSAHVVLHPADCGEVIRAGWGERHPLAHAAEFSVWTAWFHGLRRRRLPLPSNAVLVYAPRTPEQKAVFETIIDAAVWWATLN